MKNENIEINFLENNEENISSSSSLKKNSSNPSSFKRKHYENININTNEEKIIFHSLEEKKTAINSLFGFRPFSHHITKRSLKERSEKVRELYEKTPTIEEPKDNFITISNILWLLFFGWWFFLIYFIISIILFITYFGKSYSLFCWKMKSYYLWPFGKYIVLTNPKKNDENSYLLKKDYYSKNEHFIGTVLWFLLAIPMLVICHLVSFIICWMGVISIPMAKINLETIKILLQKPLQYDIYVNLPTANVNVKLCTYNAINIYYYKYAIKGINIIFFNLIPCVFLTLLFGYAIPHSLQPPPLVIFLFSLLSEIPLSYYIGMAISSISVQSSFGVGAVLNATFGSIIEIVLYATAITKGTLNDFVHASITGSLLATMLLLPGIAMIVGGIKYKEQKFNTQAAGVSNILLIISVVGALTPTIVYFAWGSYTLDCQNCLPIFPNSTKFFCSSCQYKQVESSEDNSYEHRVKPLMYAVSALMPIAYIVGLIFTLKTHSYIYEDNFDESGENENIPEWTKLQCVIILIISTVVFSFITDTMLNALEATLEILGIQQSFVGILFIGIINNSAEIFNAINFALKDNIALSIELGYAGTIQTSLIQIPFLVIFSAIVNHTHGSIFSLVFPTLNLFSIFLGVIIVNYISTNGKTNYFEGTALVIVYIVFIIAFLFQP